MYSMYLFLSWDVTSECERSVLSHDVGIYSVGQWAFSFSQTSPFKSKFIV